MTSTPALAGVEPVPVVLAAAEVLCVSPYGELFAALVLFAALLVLVLLVLLPQPAANRATVEATAASAKGLLTVVS
jgi:hypothetical protein